MGNHTNHETQAWVSRRGRRLQWAGVLVFLMVMAAIFWQPHGERQSHDIFIMAVWSGLVTLGVLAAFRGGGLWQGGPMIFTAVVVAIFYGLLRWVVGFAHLNNKQMYASDWWFAAGIPLFLLLWPLLRSPWRQTLAAVAIIAFVAAWIKPALRTMGG